MDQLAADEEKTLREKFATVPDPTILAKVNDISLLNDIRVLTEDLQVKMGVKIPLEQVGSLEECPTVKSATELE